MHEEHMFLDPLSSQCDHYTYLWKKKLWDETETQRLKDLLNLVRIGYVYNDFDPNEWYPLGFELAKNGIPCLWLACMDNLKLSPPDPFIIPYQTDDAVDIYTSVSWWLQWYPENVLPVWDAKNKVLSTRHNPSGLWEVEDVHILLHSFGTPKYAKSVEKQLQIIEALDLPNFKYRLTQSQDLELYFRWLSALNVKVNPPKPEITKLPELE